jgi:Insertion element 4 transposase N-terminal/Transposase DDE domain
MARTAAGLPAGLRITDFISLGVIAKTFPLAKVHEVLAETGKTSVRQRELPAHVMIYYVIALALYRDASCREVLRCLLEGLQFLRGSPTSIKPTGKSGISQARSRLGYEAAGRLHDETVKPIATPATKGAWFKRWRLVSLDGSTLDVPDEPELEAAFGRPGAGHGESAYPQIRFVSLVENGTHVLFGTRMAGCSTSEIALTKDVLSALAAGMLCLADRNFFGYEMWRQAQATGADLLWRIKRNARLPCEQPLPDGSYLSHIYPSETDRRHKTNGVKVRVIDYCLEGVADAEPIYRLVTTILDPAIASAKELAALYHERWEIETALGELKTYVRAGKIVLRSKTQELVRQEFFGMLMLHYAIRGLMHEAALSVDEDPDRLSFLHAIRVVRRKLPMSGVFSPSAQACAA